MAQVIRAEQGRQAMQATQVAGAEVVRGRGQHNIFQGTQIQFQKRQDQEEPEVQEPQQEILILRHAQEVLHAG